MVASARAISTSLVMPSDSAATGCSAMRVRFSPSSRLLDPVVLLVVRPPEAARGDHVRPDPRSPGADAVGQDDVLADGQAAEDLGVLERAG